MWLSREPIAIELPSGENSMHCIGSWPSVYWAISSRVCESYTIHLPTNVPTAIIKPVDEKAHDWICSPMSLLQTTECDSESHSWSRRSWPPVTNCGILGLTARPHSSSVWPVHSRRNLEIFFQSKFLISHWTWSKQLFISYAVSFRGNYLVRRSTIKIGWSWRTSASLILKGIFRVIWWHLRLIWLWLEYFLSHPISVHFISITRTTKFQSNLTSKQQCCDCKSAINTHPLWPARNQDPYFRSICSFSLFRWVIECLCLRQLHERHLLRREIDYN